MSHSSVNPWKAPLTGSRWSGFHTKCDSSATCCTETYTPTEGSENPPDTIHRSPSPRKPQHCWKFNGALEWQREGLSFLPRIWPHSLSTRHRSAATVLDPADTEISTQTQHASFNTQTAHWDKKNNTERQKLKVQFVCVNNDILMISPLPKSWFSL